MQVHIRLFGSVLNPLDCYLLERGLKTLALRVERASDNALRLAQWLHSHPAVHRVLYPGLPSHPNHSVAQKQMKCAHTTRAAPDERMRCPPATADLPFVCSLRTVFGGIVNAELRADLASSYEAIRRLQLTDLAVSLGGVESTVSFPCEPSLGFTAIQEERKNAGIVVRDNLMRVNVGIEDWNDLRADWEQALKPLIK
jgi:cysteine-S-conjugate beta-lyase